MAIRILDFAVFLVDDKLTFLIFTDLTTIVDCILLFIEMFGGSLAPSLLKIPATGLVGNCVMSFAWHFFPSSRIWHSVKIKRPKLLKK